MDNVDYNHDASEEKPENDVSQVEPQSVDSHTEATVVEDNFNQPIADPTPEPLQPDQATQMALPPTTAPTMAYPPQHTLPPMTGQMPVQAQPHYAPPTQLPPQASPQVSTYSPITSQQPPAQYSQTPQYAPTPMYQQPATHQMPIAPVTPPLNPQLAAQQAIARRMPKAADDFPNPLLLLALLGALLKSQPQEAFKAAIAARKTWLLALLSYAIIGGLFSANWAWQSYSAATNTIGSLASYFSRDAGSYIFQNGNSILGFDFGVWLKYFVTSAAFAAIGLLVFSVVLMLASSITGKKVPFTTATSIASVCSLPVYGLSLITTVIWCIPSTATFGLGMLILIVVYPCFAFAQILWGFEWLTTSGPVKKSPTVSYSLLLLLALVVKLIFFVILQTL